MGGKRRAMDESLDEGDEKRADTKYRRQDSRHSFERGEQTGQPQVIVCG
jgi:hypothetical protein